MRVQSRPLLRAALGFVLTGAALLAGGPARAGEYEIVPSRVSGDLTLTPLYGPAPPPKPLYSPNYDSTRDPDVGTPYFGTIQYTYTERFDYTWIADPENPGEPPEPTTCVVEGLMHVGLGFTSSSAELSGASSGTADFASDTFTARLRSHPEEDLLVIDESYGWGTCLMWKEIELSEASGSFQLTYTVTASTANSAHAVQIRTFRCPDVKKKRRSPDRIRITAINPPAPVIGGGDIDVSWDATTYTVTTYRVDLLSWHIDDRPEWTDRETGPPWNAHFAGSVKVGVSRWRWDQGVSQNMGWSVVEVRLIKTGGPSPGISQIDRKKVWIKPGDDGS
jgi:hypothetical protein